MILFLQIVFHMEKTSGHIVSDQEKEEYLLMTAHDFQAAQCYPLYSFLLALGKTTVDYLSLDVESSEYKVLQSVPWDKVDIKVRKTVFK